MNKRFSWIFLLASGAFFVFIVGLTGYRIEEARDHNAAAARERATSLAAKVRSLRDITGNLQSPLFKTDMREVFDNEARLLLLCLHSQQDGILYFVARNRSVLKQPTQITPDWHGTPAYQLNVGSELLISSSLGDDMPSVTMDTLFVTLGNEDLYPTVRDDLYFFLAFLLVCGVAVLIVLSMQNEPQSLPSQPPATRFAQEPDHMPATPPPASFSHRAEEPSRALTSPRTGLVWAEYLEPRLKAELERAASSDQDLSLAYLRIDEPFADGRLPLTYLEIARLLTQSFPLHDLIFEKGDDSYAIVVPDSGVDAAVRLLEDFRGKLASSALEGMRRTVSIGVSSRGGRLIDASILREEAEAALAKASREGGNQVIGFRADAARFRETLTGTTT
jgi:GGDEF domain-containing protein